MRLGPLTDSEAPTSGGGGNRCVLWNLQTTSCLLRAQSPKTQLGRPARSVQAGGGMQHLRPHPALWSRPLAVGKVKGRTCEERDADHAPLMAPC